MSFISKLSAKGGTRKKIISRFKASRHKKKLTKKPRGKKIRKTKRKISKSKKRTKKRGAGSKFSRTNRPTTPEAIPVADVRTIIPSENVQGIPQVYRVPNLNLDDNSVVVTRGRRRRSETNSPPPRLRRRDNSLEVHQSSRNSERDWNPGQRPQILLPHRAPIFMWSDADSSDSD